MFNNLFLHRAKLVVAEIFLQDLVHHIPLDKNTATKVGNNEIIGVKIALLFCKNGSSW